MSDNWAIGLTALVIGLSVVLATLGGLALLTYAIGWFEKRLKALETKPVLKSESEGIDPRVVAAIIAAISASEKRHFRVRRIRYLQADGTDEAWQEISRTQLLLSRQVGRKG